MGCSKHGLGTHLGEEHHAFLQPPDQRFLVLPFLLLIQELALDTQDFLLQLLPGLLQHPGTKREKTDPWTPEWCLWSIRGVRKASEEKHDHGSVTLVLQLHHWKLGSCSLIISCCQKKMWGKSQPKGQPSCAARDNYWNLTGKKHLNNCTSVSKSIRLPLRTWLVFNKQHMIFGSTGSLHFFLTKEKKKLV